jgi:hypothetical protein
MVIVNTSVSPRVFFLPSGALTIAPGEMKLITPEQEDEVKQLIRSPHFVDLVDRGYLSVSNKKADILKAQQLTPPDTLDTTKHIPGTGITVAANSKAEFDPNTKEPITVVGSAEVGEK